METATFKTKLKRVMRSGFFNFWRSGYVSLASVLVMVITLSVISSVIFLGAILRMTLDELRDKVDVNVYFLTTTEESEILSLQERIAKMPEVESVVYLSREQALTEFKVRHENDQVTLQALEELGDNPLGASLNIKAKDPSQYAGLAEFLNQENILSRNGAPIIDKINYFQNKTVIDRLTRIINSSQKLGTALTLVLVIISVLITLNTVRLAIYISKDEISVMQLVGASKNYIKGPFLVTGIMYGAFAGVITLLIFLPATYWLGALTEGFFAGINIFDYYISNIFEMMFIILGSGIVIGTASSYLAVRKYLKL